jgi:hypothetical protein
MAGLYDNLQFYLAAFCSQALRLPQRGFIANIIRSP